MHFHSLEFLFFTIAVFFLYWFVTNKYVRIQNLLIIIGSYFFYGWWDYRFLSLLILNTVVNYIAGLKIYAAKSDKTKYRIMLAAVIYNLVVLGFFKYFNFFIESWVDGFSYLGYHMSPFTLNIILPLGISFYTFQTMSYALDIYKKKMNPTNDIIAFAAFVTFFPQLVAGPIERASNLLKQFNKRRYFNYPTAVDGCRQIVWGLFKKLVIADNCAPLVADIFNNYSTYPGYILMFGALLFSFQIYGDFSGYSDIAIGTAKLFGIDLKVNFNYPYFAKNISDFWKRWHISLSSWLNDYVFTPLAITFREYNKRGVYAALLITFLLSGLWHGAGWNFVVWGGLHGLYYIPVIFSKKRFGSIASSHFKMTNIYKVGDMPKIVGTFTLVTFTYIFFRAKDLESAFGYIYSLFQIKPITSLYYFDVKNSFVSVILILLFVLIEWIGRKDEYALKYFSNAKSRLLRWFLYAVIIFIIGMFMVTEETPFIYFQF